MHGGEQMLEFGGVVLLIKTKRLSTGKLVEIKDVTVTNNNTVPGLSLVASGGVSTTKLELDLQIATMAKGPLGGISVKAINKLDAFGKVCDPSALLVCCPDVAA